jgi:hypothetical protein
VTKTVKLIKVTNGLYRTEDGNCRVTFVLPWRGKPAHWTVDYTNWHGCPVTKEFSTLRAAREWLNGARN